MNHDEAIRYLTDRGNFGIQPGLERIALLLDKLESPHKCAPCVHVAGTNGKGSAASILTSILSAAGLKVGKYTSPHLERWNERINIDGRDATDEDLSNALTAVKEASEVKELLALTQFELITAAAFWLFKRAGVDFIVIEAGMGGRLDATNVIVPECSIITNVSLDHDAYLGKTLEAIAGEKAGIIKPGVPVITGAESVALNIVVDKASALHCPLYTFHVDFTAISTGGGIDRQNFLFRQGTFMANFTMPLGGGHQIANAALAVMAAKLLSEKYPAVTIKAMQTGIENTRWPARLELHSKEPDVILDGAHNAGGAHILRAALDRYYKGKSICFVLGIMKDKDIKAIVDELIQPCDCLFAVLADETERAAPPADIAAVSPGKSFVFDDLAQAIAKL